MDSGNKQPPFILYAGVISSLIRLGDTPSLENYKPAVQKVSIRPEVSLSIELVVVSLDLVPTELCLISYIKSGNCSTWNSDMVRRNGKSE